MLLSAILLALHLSIILPTTTLDRDSNPTELSQLQATESHLKAKATLVLERFTDQPFTVDLHVELDQPRTLTTLYQPGPGDEGTWQESLDYRPSVRQVMCCVTLRSEADLDVDHLFRCLSYNLGIDLSRGDLLKIVTL